jgi:hypothetical protein
MKVQERCPASGIVFSGWALLGMTPPRAVMGNSVQQIIERDLRTILRRQTSETVFTLATAQVAADANDDIWNPESLSTMLLFRVRSRT